MKTKICITLFLRSFFSRRARRFLSKSAALITFSVVAFIPAVMRGNTVTLAFTGGSEENIRGAITVGWAFSLSSPTLVTDVGLWDFQGDGLGQAHDVTIWTSTGTQLIQMTIPSGTGSTLNNGFRYEPLTTATLLPSGNYIISAFYPDSSPDGVTVSAATVTTASGVTFGGSRSEGGNAFPSGDIAGGGGVSNGYFGPDFQFASPANSVPDDCSTWCLLAFGTAAIIGIQSLLIRAQTR